jgi:hypothetical protein
MEGQANNVNMEDKSRGHVDRVLPMKNISDGVESKKITNFCSQISDNV